MQHIKKKYFSVVAEAVIKYKYDALRTYFVKEWKKIHDSKKSGAGTEQIYESKWEWFKALLFLKDTVSVGPTSSSLEDSSADVSK